MKIPPANPLPTRPNAETGRVLNRRGQVSADAPRADDAGESVEAGGAPERDFASVFDEVVSRPERRQEESSDGDRRVSRETERPEHEASARRRDGREEREGGSNQTGADSRGGGFDTRASLREVSAAGEPTSARSILHVADLERIVSAVRAQLTEGGGHVVTIELRRSVLEGLKVRLSAEAGGGVTAEFIAGSERVRSQLDARSGELAELLRGRGVSLAALRVSVDSGGVASGGEGGDPRGGHPRASVVERAATPAASDAAPADAAESGGDTSNTYRA